MLEVMTIIELVILLVVVGVALYLVNALIPMQTNVKRILNVLIVTVVGIVAFVWLLGFLGVNVSRRL